MSKSSFFRIQSVSNSLLLQSRAISHSQEQITISNQDAAHKTQNLGGLSPATQEENELVTQYENQNRMTEEICYILKQKQKSDEQIETLAEFFRKIPLFETLENQLTVYSQKEAYYYILTHLSIEEYEKGSLIFKESTPSDGKVYIVLQGSVSIFARKLDRYMQLTNMNPDDGGLDLNLLQKFESDESGTEEGDNNDSAIDDGMSGYSSPVSVRRLVPNPNPTSGFSIKLHKNQSSFFPNEDLLFEQNHHFGGDSPSKTQTQKKSRVRKFKVSASKPALVVMKYKAQQKDEIPSPNRTISPLRKKTTRLDKEQKNGKFVQSLEAGQIFGERVLYVKQKRYMTAITAEKSQLIVLTVDAFKNGRKVYDSLRTKLIHYLITIFPSMNFIPRATLYSSLINSMSEKTFPSKGSVTVEGKKDENFYLLIEGECDVYRQVEMRREDPYNPLTEVKDKIAFSMSQREHIKLHTIQRGTLVGEESFFNKDGKNRYTVKVHTSDAKFFVFNKAKMMNKFGKDPIKDIKKIFIRKQLNNSDMLAQILQIKGYCLDQDAFLEQDKVIAHRNPNIRSGQNSPIKEKFIKELGLIAGGSGRHKEIQPEMRLSEFPDCMSSFYTPEKRPKSSVQMSTQIPIIPMYGSVILSTERSKLMTSFNPLDRNDRGSFDMDSSKIFGETMTNYAKMERPPTSPGTRRVDSVFFDSMKLAKGTTASILSSTMADKLEENGLRDAIDIAKTARPSKVVRETKSSHQRTRFGSETVRIKENILSSIQRTPPQQSMVSGMEIHPTKYKFYFDDRNVRKDVTKYIDKANVEEAKTVGPSKSSLDVILRKQIEERERETYAPNPKTIVIKRTTNSVFDDAKVTKTLAIDKQRRSSSVEKFVNIHVERSKHSQKKVFNPLQRSPCLALPSRRGSTGESNELERPKTVSILTQTTLEPRKRMSNNNAFILAAKEFEAQGYRSRRENSRVFEDDSMIQEYEGRKELYQQ